MFTARNAAPLLIGFVFLMFAAASFSPIRAPRHATAAPTCTPGAKAFEGYTFVMPEIVNIRGAYTPFFAQWGRAYRMYFDTIDFQKKENMEEWSSRFCDLPDPRDVETVVHEVRTTELMMLGDLARRKKGQTELPFPFKDNSFAQCIVFNGCDEVVDYLLFARKCEPHVTTLGNTWRIPERDPATMQNLIREAKQRFKATHSHFLKMRYAYQAIRLAHYAGQWRQTIDLFNELIPQIETRPDQPSVIYYWILGHAAGALQKMGRYADAAYRYSLVFSGCASKREQAFRSFKIRNDEDWEGALRLCQSDHERSTLYLMRAGRYHINAVEDIRQVYELDPTNAHLPLLLVSEIQQLEKIYLRTPVTDRKYGIARAALRRDRAAEHLLGLQELVRTGSKEGKISNMPLWRSLDGYLELLAGDYYAAEKTWQKVERDLSGWKDNEKALLDQIEVWRTLSEIMQLDTGRVFNYAKAESIRSYKSFEKHPDFEPFMQDYVADYYAKTNHPGKAVLAAYGPKALRYNPDPLALDDLLREARAGNADFIDMTAEMDTSIDGVVGQILEMKAMAYLNKGELEAAVVAKRAIPRAWLLEDQKRYYPFREFISDSINRNVVGDSIAVTRAEFVEALLDLELKAKASEAAGTANAAWYYYLLGLGYYNTSYFGYAWEVRDYYRSGYNWLRLATGPVFSLASSPHGNRENIDLSLALSYFEKALQRSISDEMGARAAFMAARCRQKMWFSSPGCTYKPGNKLVPRPPAEYFESYQVLIQRYPKSQFYQQAIKECKWLNLYAN